MKYIEFKKSVKSIVTPKDYELSSSDLEYICSDDYDLFLRCLKLGSNLIASVLIVDKLKDLSNDMGISTEDLLTMSLRFRIIDHLFNLKD